MYDLVIVGGGTAGSTAAIAAARRGLRTLLIEKNTALGGTSTLGLVMPLMVNHIAGKPLNLGLNQEINQRYCKSFGDGSSERDASYFDPLLLSLLLEEMVLEAGADLLYDCTVYEALVEGRTIKEIALASQKGPLTFSSKLFIDASGNLVLGRLAGCRTVSGDEEGKNQPMSLRFILDNVQLEEAVAGLEELGICCKLPYLSVGFHEAKDSPLAGLIQQAVAAGVLQEEDLGYFQFFSLPARPGSLAFNCPRLQGFDPVDPWQVSAAYSEGRRKIARITDFLRRYLPGFQAAAISSIAPLVGIRESVRVVGEYTLTEDDYFNARSFPDGIVRNRYPIDIHHPTGRGTTLKYLPEGLFHEIPYRCLIPKDLDNLLVAGRCISASFPAQAAIRIIPNCRALGEAAGTAAALAISNSCSLRENPIDELKAALALT